MSALKFIQLVARKKVSQKGGEGITTIGNRMNAETKAGEIAETFRLYGLTPDKWDDFIKSEKDVLKYLNIIESTKKQAIEQATKKSKDILKVSKKKERPFTGWTPKVVERSMPADDYYNFKEEWFGKIIANTDDDINTWLKKGINASDERFVALSKDQRKDFLDMVEYRLKHGNEKFMNDSEMFFKKNGRKPHEYGGIAGMLGERTGFHGGGFLPGGPTKEQLEAVGDTFGLWSADPGGGHTFYPQTRPTGPVEVPLRGGPERGGVGATLPPQGFSSFEEMMKLRTTQDIPNFYYDLEGVRRNPEGGLFTPKPGQLPTTITRPRPGINHMDFLQNQQMGSLGIGNQQPGPGIGGQLPGVGQNIFGNNPMEIAVPTVPGATPTPQPMPGDTSFGVMTAFPNLKNEFFPTPSEEQKITDPYQQSESYRRQQDTTPVTTPNEFINRRNPVARASGAQPGALKQALGLAGGGLAPLLGEPTYQDEDHRIPLKGGKSASYYPAMLDVTPEELDYLSPEEMIHIIKLLQTGEIPQFAGGGRIGFSEGKGPKMSRRSFLKAAAGLAALPIVGKFFKFAKPAAKVADLTQVPIKNADGMPPWFKPLVNRVIKEGDDITNLPPIKGGAMNEREIVHSAKLGEGQGVRVTQNLDDQTIRVEYQSADNMGGIDDAVRLEYKAAEEVEPILAQHMNPKDPKGPWLPNKAQKTKPTFEASEAYPLQDSKDYKNITWEGDNTVNEVKDLHSDISALKQFGTGKPLSKKELEIAKQKRQRVKEIHNNPHEELAGTEYVPDYDDFASGGRVSFKLGGKGKVLEGLAELMEQFFPGTTKIGQRSKSYPEKVQEKMDLRKAIADFYERQKNKKLRRIGDNNPPSPIEEEAVTNKKIRETIKADEKTLAKLQKEHNKKYGPGREGGDEPMSDALYKQMVEDHKKTVAIENRILENRIKINDPPTKDDYQYYSEQLDNPDADYYPVKGNETLAELEAMIKKADADYEAEKKYWQKVFKKDDKKQMEKYGVLVNRLTEKNKLYKEFPNITDHQVADILRTDLDGTIDPRKIEAAKETLRKQTGSPWYTDPKTLTPEEELRREFPGISDDLIKNILADDNPQRIAEVKATLKEALKMQQKGMGPEEIINIFKKKPTKHASGGLAGMLGE